MGSFSIRADDSYLLNRVGAADSVCIIACPHCANQSIAYTKGMSIIGKSSLGGLYYKPYAIIQEAKRLKELFASKGITSRIEIFKKIDSPPCWLHEKERKSISKACEKANVAVTLCCSAGCNGIKTALPESFKVVAGATVGTICSYISIEKGKDILDKEKTEVTHFKKMKTPM